MSEWYEDRRNLASVARYMGERGDSVDDVAYMLEKPHKFEDDWRQCAGLGLRAEVGRATARLASVPPHARACRGVLNAACVTCSGRGVWMDEPCSDCDA